MSFWPFPKTLLERMRAAASGGACVELGAGGGDFRQRLRQVGIDSIALDVDFHHLRQLEGDRVAARVEQLPFGRGVFGLMTMSNLMRHFDVDERHEALDACASHLTARGALLLLEDAPTARDESERNYRQCLHLLAQVDRSRGDVMDLDSVVSSKYLALSERGSFENSTELKDPAVPLRWLAARSLDADTRERVEELSRRVERWGMRVGQASYQLWEPQS